MQRRSADERSFVGEHTVEYTLVDELVSVLRKEWPFVVPFYFWGDREGSNMSQSCDNGCAVRVLAVYPRRPKVRFPCDDQITVKFNGLLFEHADRLAQRGVPLLAGVPLATEIWALGQGVQYRWFQIDGVGQVDGDCEIVLGATDGGVVGHVPNGVRGPLTHRAILELVANECCATSWSNAIQVIGKARSKLERPPGPFGLGSRYHPVYFALREIARPPGGTAASSI